MSTTLNVRIEATTHDRDLADTFEALDDGEDVPGRAPCVSFESLAAFGRVFRPTNLELLAAIVEHDPESIRELARAVDRHPPEVTDNVHELADVGLLELETHGRSKRPVVWYDELDVDIPLGPDVAGSAHA